MPARSDSRCCVELVLEVLHPGLVLLGVSSSFGHHVIHLLMSRVGLRHLGDVLFREGCNVAGGLAFEYGIARPPICLQVICFMGVGESYADASHAGILTT